ncbi:MAG: sensor histidine kinase [Roseibium sp.]
MIKPIQTNLDRDDVLLLLERASSMKPNAIESMLSLFCDRMEGRVRFASLWKYNKCSKSISIYARSDQDYFPQLGSQGENIQEFICSTACPTVNMLLESPELLARQRKNFSIKGTGLYGLFHPKDTAEKYGLDQFVFLPIDAEHAPKGEAELPRFFCLLYCPTGVVAENIHGRDLELIQRCLGNMVFNTFSARRQSIIKQLTNFLASSHDSGSARVLEYLRTNCIQCSAAFQVTIRSLRNKEFDIAEATGNSLRLTQSAMLKLWENSSEIDGASIIAANDLPTDLSAKSALIWQQRTENPRERTMYLFADKISDCPLQGMGDEPPGVMNYVDHFGFDDCELLTEIGSHIGAFTETSAEKKRRDNNSRIVAHESSQPFFDIRNQLAKHSVYPKHYTWEDTIERINDAAILGHAMVEMNTELTEEKLRRMPLFGKTTYLMDHELSRLKRSLRRVCEDARFPDSALNIDVSPACRSLEINMRIVTTIFINTVTNSIKYSNRKKADSWCNFGVKRVYSGDFIAWSHLGIPKNRQRTGILFTTSDNGIGIPQKYKERIFEQEFQVDNRRAARGLGLGLWHVKRIVNAMAGDIWVQSDGDFTAGSEIKTRVSVLLPTEKR